MIQSKKGSTPQLSEMLPVIYPEGFLVKQLSAVKRSMLDISVNDLNRAVSSADFL